MTIWILHETLTPEEEAHMRERSHLALPLGALPDLSRATQPEQCREMLKLLYPHEPPEAITRRLDALWAIYGSLAPEDIIAVPLRERQEVALAEISGPYEYQVGVDGTDVHRVPVRWYDSQPSIRRFGKHAGLFIYKGGRTMTEVMGKDARVAIRDKLPHRYNRFVKWKWLLALFFLMSLVRFFERMSQH